MKWDSSRRVYVTDGGKDISPADIRQYIDDWIDSEQEDIDSHTAELLAGAITIAAFFEYLREKLVAMHGAAGVLAYGGEDEMNATRWTAVGEKLASELDYLDNFEAQVERAYKASEELASGAAREVLRDSSVSADLESLIEQKVIANILQNSVSDVESAISEGIREAVVDSIGTEAAGRMGERIAEDLLEREVPRLEDLIWGEVESRARQYLDAAYGTYENSVKAREGEAGAIGARRITEGDDRVCADCEELASEDYAPLDEVADIGDSICGSNCRCTIEFSYGEVEGLEIEREVYA